MEGERKKRENTKEKKKIKTGAWGQESPREKERERDTTGCLCVTLFHMELMVA